MPTPGFLPVRASYPKAAHVSPISADACAQTGQNLINPHDSQGSPTSSSIIKLLILGLTVSKKDVMLAT